MQQRQSARAILLNERDHVLLIQHEDTNPVDPAQPDVLYYWVMLSRTIPELVYLLSGCVKCRWGLSEREIISCLSQFNIFPVAISGVLKLLLLIQ